MYLCLRKDPILYKKTSKTSPILLCPPKYSQNRHTPKIFKFLKTPKNIENQNFEPQNMDQAYVYMKMLEYPLGLEGPQ